jgi:hypothetical protein
MPIELDLLFYFPHLAAPETVVSLFSYSKYTAGCLAGPRPGETELQQYH